MGPAQRTCGRLIRTAPQLIAAWLAVQPVLVWAGTTVPRHFAFQTLDDAACECLAWAWSLNRKKEIAGGIVRRQLTEGSGKFTCSTLTKGSSYQVTFRLERDWLASFHTHTQGSSGSSEALSESDTLIARVLDPLSRPLFVRTPRGRVLKYHQRRTRTVPCRVRLPSHSALTLQEPLGIGVARETALDPQLLKENVLRAAEGRD